jgi:hypothetical protein
LIRSDAGYREELRTKQRLFDENFWLNLARNLGYPVQEERLDINTLVLQRMFSRD